MMVGERPCHNIPHSGDQPVPQPGAAHDESGALTPDDLARPKHAGDALTSLSQGMFPAHAQTIVDSPQPPSGQARIATMRAAAETMTLPMRTAPALDSTMPRRAHPAADHAAQLNEALAWLTRQLEWEHRLDQLRAQHAHPQSEKQVP